ncbi:MAG: NAD(P)/FAD-dependent oxidoreductase [Cyanobacteria bacterium P01_F01_bin.150]
MQKAIRAVVVGGGFGGMQAAQSLAKLGIKTLLIDRNNYNTFVPLLYQVAAAQIEPEKIAYPLRTAARCSDRLYFQMAEVKHIDFETQQIETDRSVIPYDFLVLATGSRTQYFGVAGAKQHAFSMRNLDEAIAIRNHIFGCFEQASNEPDPIVRRQLLTFIVVGGGATGVEMAGTLVELKRSLMQDYPYLNFADVRIIMVQSGEGLLRELPHSLGNYTLRTLRRLGVEVLLQARVNQVTPEGICLDSGKELSAATVVWTAGLEASRPLLSEHLETANRGKVVVQPTLQLKGYPNVYVIGDLAHVSGQGPSLAGVAPEALQQGVAVARNIERQSKWRAPKPFRYFNKGRLAIIGCYSGVGKIGPFLLTGFLPWFMWLAVHLVYLPGVRSRLLVLLSWIHGYSLRDRPIRLILSSKFTTTRHTAKSHSLNRAAESQMNHVQTK